MNAENVGTTITAEKTETETMSAPESHSVSADGTNLELGLDDLVNYRPVPPRRVTRISVHFQRHGRGVPLPYFVDETGPE
jgi:hypothetical protein